MASRPYITTLRLAALLGTPLEHPAEKLGLYDGIVLRTVDEAQAACNAALHRLHAIQHQSTPSSEGNAVDAADDDDFEVWKESAITDDLIETAKVELARQDDELRTLERSGPAFTKSTQEFWRGRATFD